MKKIVIFILMGFISICGFAQTATNFNCKDCSSVNHDLFAELDAGKVIVMAWVMPCATCIGPALAAYTEVQNYQNSHPGKVLFYLADDYANTSCASLGTWANTNSMAGATKFSNASISMKHYGTDGMPKIVIIAGKDHNVYFNQNDELDVPDFKKALEQAVAASTVGVVENTKNDFQARLHPCPVSDGRAILSYYLTEPSHVTVDVFNALGVKIKDVLMEKQSIGKQDIQLDIASFSNGIYYVKLSGGSSLQTVKFIVSR